MKLSESVSTTIEGVLTEAGMAYFGSVYSDAIAQPLKPSFSAELQGPPRVLIAWLRHLADEIEAGRQASANAVIRWDEGSDDYTLTLNLSKVEG